MSDPETPAQGSARREQQMRWLARVILVVGFSFAAWIFVSAPEDGAQHAEFVETVQTSKRQQLELARIGGKGAVMMAEFSAWFAEQWQGRALARTIAIITILAAAAVHPARKG